jgi:CheY-like chemotaxis protein
VVVAQPIDHPTRAARAGTPVGRTSDERIVDKKPMNRTVIAVVDDLFFASKIRGTAEQVGVTVTFARTVESAIETAIRDQPPLIICDLNSQRIDPVEFAQALKANEHTSHIPLLGFFSHVQTELQSQAQEAGFDRVIPRSAFTKFLPQILSGTEMTG